MKYYIVLITLLLSLSYNAEASLYVVGFNSGGGNTPSFKEVANIIMKLKPKDRFRLYNLKGKYKVVAAIDIPEGNAFNNKRVLVSHFATELKAIKTYLNASRPPTTAEEDYFLFPQFMNELSVHLIKPEEKAHILVVGNGMYNDKREPHFSMLNERFPSDGHLNTDIETSVYSTLDKKDYLKNVMVNFVYTNTWDTDIHRNRVNRFWSLFVKSQGGQLVSFTPDIGTGITRFLDDNPNILVDYTLDKSDREVTMIELRRETAKKTNTREALTGINWLKDNVSIFSGKPRKFRGSLKVGIRWNCKDCDYDLWVKSDKENNWLFFGNKKTGDGFFNKDYLNSPDKANALEYIVVDRDVDIRKLNIRVNLYSGTTSDDREGEIRAYYNGRVYSTPFNIKAVEGNKGDNYKSPEDDDHWFVADTKKLFNLL